MSAQSDQGLRYIESLQHAGHTIKLVRRGNVIKALIYAPGELLAAHLVEASINDYRRAVRDAKERIEKLIAGSAFHRLLGELEPKGEGK